MQQIPLQQRSGMWKLLKENRAMWERDGGVLLGRAGRTAPCIQQVRTSAGYFPHSWPSRWLPGAQQLHKPCKCKGQCCHGIAALWWEAKPARNLGAPGFQLPADSIKQTLTATEKIFGFWRPQVNFGLRW